MNIPDPKEFYFSHGDCISISSFSLNSDTHITVTTHADFDGNDLKEPISINIALDNFQMYQLALEFLSRVGVEDSRSVLEIFNKQ
jgi:hypothetical protein